MQQEVLNAEKKKAEAMKTRSDLLTKLSVMMNTSAKLKTEETKNAKRLQASFKEMDHLEEKARYRKNIETVRVDIKYGVFRVQSDKMGEWYVQFNYDLQKLKAMVSCNASPRQTDDGLNWNIVILHNTSTFYTVLRWKFCRIIFTYIGIPIYRLDWAYVLKIHKHFRAKMKWKI